MNPWFRSLKVTRFDIPAVLLSLVFIVASGCSSFNRGWKKAASAPTPTDSIAGRWEGTWRSDVNGHNGGLRCLMTPSTNGLFSARFHATYKLWFLPVSGSYTVPLSARANGGQWEFVGDADLGWYAGGHYRYRGNASDTNFFSTYDSKHDRGVFEMRRPK